MSLPLTRTEDSKLVIPPPNRFAAALSGIFSGPGLHESLAQALLLSHHPIVCHSRKGAQSVWKGVAKRAFGGDLGLDSLLQLPAVAADIGSGVTDALQAQVVLDR